jgi:hypothetical protein
MIVHLGMERFVRIHSGPKTIQDFGVVATPHTPPRP